VEFSVEKIIAIIIATLLILAWGILFATIIKDAEKKEKPEKKKNSKKILKKNRKDLIKRIKSMTPEQFDAYYETLVEIYGRECFYKTFSKRYVKKLMEK
jgi:hypothetical protein